MKTSRVITLIVILLIVLGAVLWSCRVLFQQNHVMFLLNQRSFDEAVALLHRLEQADPDNLRTDFLQVKTLTITGDYKRAAQIEESEALATKYPESLYWRALAEYQIDEGSSSGRHALAFIRTGRNLPNGAGKIARVLAGENILLEPQKKDAMPYRLLFPVEKAVYTSIVARQQVEVGKLENAADIFRRAFILGSRNLDFLYLAAKVCALVGQVQDARMFFDFSRADSIQPLFENFKKAYNDYRIVSLTLHNEDLAQGGRKIDVARALAWAANVYIQENPDKHRQEVAEVMSELVREYPYDVVLQVRKAGMFEELKQYDSAYRIYQTLQRKFPNYTVLIRKSATQGLPDDEFTSQSEAFMRTLDFVSSVPINQVNAENGIRKSHYIAFHENGSAKTSMVVPQRGSYILMIIARGDRAAGIAPLVKVLVDDEVAGYVYIGREDWDCYTLTLPLEEGSHSFELEYDNDEVEGEAADMVNRSFYLRAIYVTITGVADVR